MFVDSHCHINFKAFTNDVDAVIKRAKDAEVKMIVVGTQRDTSARAVELAKKYSDSVWAAIGLHPAQVVDVDVEEEVAGKMEKFKARAEVFERAFYEELLQKSGVVAVGEIGLDRIYANHAADPAAAWRAQLEAFEAQLEFARETSRPVIIHCREAYPQLIELLHRVYGPWKQESPRRGVQHFFAGSEPDARELMSLGFLLSFTGVITFAPEYEKLVASVPLDWLMIETDAPYVTPVPHRGKRNEPAYVVEVAKKITEIKKASLDEVAEITSANARALFKLSG